MAPALVHTYPAQSPEFPHWPRGSSASMSKPRGQSPLLFSAWAIRATSLLALCDARCDVPQPSPPGPTPRAGPPTPGDPVSACCESPNPVHPEFQGASVINSWILTKEKKSTTASQNPTEGVPMTTAEDNRTAILTCVVALCVISLFFSAVLFDRDFSSEDKYCNSHICTEIISIASVAFGVLSVGNPVSVGVVSLSSFVAIGILPIAPVAIGVVPIGIIAKGYQYLNAFAPEHED